MSLAPKKTGTGSKRVHVEIISDIVCPWCWLGTQYFLSAAERSPHSVNLRWRPFMLDPDIPEGGVNYKTYIEDKFGTGEQNKFKAMGEFLEQAGPEAGISYKFSDISIRPNTLNAHRLIRWAGGQKRATATAQKLFKAYFYDLLDIGDLDVLSDIGREVGMDRELLRRLLAGNDDKTEVLNEIRYYRKLGIAGVPSFIYEKRFLVQGAQSIEAHLKLMEQSSQLEAETSAP